MNPIGNLDHFNEAFAFPADLLPWMFRKILMEWPEFPRPQSTPLENRITNRFVGHLKSRPDIRALPFVFHFREKIPDANRDTERGELDITVMLLKPPAPYFVFECKRLNVIRNKKRYSQAGSYVGIDGMGCFISGKYIDQTHDAAGMIGYVMDNDIVYAKSAINKALQKNHKSLNLKNPSELSKSTVLPDENCCTETNHEIAGKAFLIHHLLLPYLPFSDTQS